ncbi:hypothetical protein [Plebeiibacterium sediminum]|uniref:Uncharacterized protein n=1 Tax=Plebeiibacterium sediminum TaxID=2992112 RepID=A0AAE3SFL5_9BACT|nr:hypothetical protein [Plebeiobacterium sediminum]MCW3787605.1 hypothetical protein [Plebeiobacterium sediminum]
MKAAYDSITKSSTIKLNSTINITTTDYYVKFHPTSAEQLNMLIADSLELFTLPLDYEIEEYGEDCDEVDSDGGQWLYTSVPYNYQFNTEIQYEILAELFLPESVEESDDIITQSNSNILYQIEEKSLQLTGNKEESDNNTISTLSKKRPTGYVYVSDTETGNDSVPVMGIKVRTVHWFKYGKAFTDENGYYSIDKKYRNKPRYVLIAENKSGFKIRNHFTSLATARIKVGHHSKSGYTFTIDSGSGWRFCTVNNAVVKYRNYCTNMGIGLPPSNLRITARDTDGNGAAPMLKHVYGAVGFTKPSTIVNFLKCIGCTVISTTEASILVKLFAPDIIIPAEKNLGSAKIFETTCHELAHASHYNQVGKFFWVKYINYIVANGNDDEPYGDGTAKNAELCALSEAWAYNLGYKLTLDEYGDNNSVVTKTAFEWFKPKETGDSDDDIFHPDYLYYNWYGWIPAGIMNDLVDNNQDNIRTGYTDKVNGFTYEELFDALQSDIRSPQEFRDQLLSTCDEDEIDNINDLFEAYYWN